MRKIKIAVLCSGGGTNLGALIGAEREGIIESGKIELVIANKPTAYALTRAEAAGIPTLVIENKKFSKKEEIDDE